MDIALDDYEIAIAHGRGELLILGVRVIVLLGSRPEYGVHRPREDARGARTGCAMTVGIFPRNVQLVLVMRMFDGPNSQLTLRELLDQLDKERRLAVIFSTDDMNSPHGEICL